MITPELTTILKLSVPVIVQVGERRLAMDSVLALGPGTLIELDKPWDSPLDLLVNNKVIGKGEAVKVGENFGIRILSIESQQDMVKALGS